MQRLRTFRLIDPLKMNLVTQHLDRRCFGNESEKHLKEEGREEKKQHRVLVYEGQHGKKIVLLRRISLASSLLTIPLIAGTILIDTDVIPIAAQIALIGTVGFTTISSTTMLHLVTSPYIIRLYESIRQPPVPPVKDPSIRSEEKINRDRELIAITCNVFGRLQENHFLSSETERSSHPFASFKIKKNGKHLYLFGGALKDQELQANFAKEGISSDDTKTIE